MTERKLTKKIIKEIKKAVYFNGFDVISLVMILEKEKSNAYMEALEYMKSIAPPVNIKEVYDEDLLYD